MIPETYPRVARLLQLMDNETRQPESNTDRTLWCLLKQHEAQLPDIDDCFHKSFRQMDVTRNGHIDMAVWHLLHCSTLFWQLFERVQDEMPM